MRRVLSIVVGAVGIVMLAVLLLLLRKTVVVTSVNGLFAKRLLRHDKACRRRDAAQRSANYILHCW